MGKWFNKNKSEQNEFKEVGDISNGNMYERYQAHLAQMQIDLNSMKQTIDNAGNDVIITKLDEENIVPYYLLELQTNYFINTINFEVDNYKLFNILKMMLRVAFKNGRACLYKYDNKNFICATINKIDIDLYGNIKSINITPVNDETYGTINVDKDYEKLASLNLTNENDINNVIIFKWGSAGISAWITIWKMCLIQDELLKMINVDKYSYIKKFIYKINDPLAPLNELYDYFDVNKPYIKVAKGVDLKNRFEINENVGQLNPNVLVEYYKQVMGVYYSLFGRKMNNDFKKERSVEKEINMTSENYDILEKDWLDQFKIFTMELKVKFNIDIKLLNENNTKSDDLENGGVDNGI